MAGGVGFAIPGGASVRYPRCWIEIGGTRIPCLSASVRRSAKRGADSFDARLPITLTERYGFGLAEWTDFKPQDASIIMSAAADGGDERTMVMGQIDMPHVDLASMTVDVQGRDKSSSLTEKHRNEKFANQKTTEIVQKVAKDHGLQASVTLPDSGGDYAGKQYAQDTAHLVLNRTDWELLDSLAEREGCRWYVDGTTLYFEPDDQPNGSWAVQWFPPGTAAPYMIANALRITLKRDMGAARPHQVVVKSWHGRSRKLFRAQSQMPGVGLPLIYEDHHNGKTQSQVEKLAKSRIKNATRHELGVVVHGPGDLSVDVRQQLTLSGTGTIYDQAYDIESVDWTIDGDEGFLMNVEAKGAKDGRGDPQVQTSTKGGKSKNADGPATKTSPPPAQTGKPDRGGGGQGGTSV